MNHLLTVLFSVVIAFGFCFFGFTKDKLKQKYLWIFLIIFTSDQILVRLPFIIPQIDIIGGQYNWTRKGSRRCLFNNHHFDTKKALSSRFCFYF